MKAMALRPRLLGCPIQALRRQQNEMLGVWPLAQACLQWASVLRRQEDHQRDQDGAVMHQQDDAGQQHQPGKPDASAQPMHHRPFGEHHQHSGGDQRGPVLVRIRDGKWTLVAQ